MKNFIEQTTEMWKNHFSGVASVVAIGTTGYTVLKSFIALILESVFVVYLWNWVVVSLDGPRISFLAAVGLKLILHRRKEEKRKKSLTNNVCNAILNTRNETKEKELKHEMAS